MHDHFYGMTIPIMTKAKYTIEHIRKATVDEDFSSNLLQYLDRIAESWNIYFNKQLPEYIQLADQEITPIEKVSKETYEQLYTALYEALGAIFRV
jgi:methionyl-tRNA synthetase